MNISIKTTNLSLTSEIESYADSRMAKAARLVAGDTTAKGQLELERQVSHDAGEQFRAELTLQGAGFSVRAEAVESTLHGAIDVLENQLLEELRHIKGKKETLVRRAGARMKQWLRFGR